MFKEMRRKDKQTTVEESIEALKKADYGVLSTYDSNGYPYATPLNYVYSGNSIYFHCAPVGHKLDNIEACDRVSFCVVSDVEILPDKFDTNYKSVIVFGRAKEITDKEKDDALLELIKKYSKDYVNKGQEYINKAKCSIKVIKIDIEHMSGKAQK